MSPPEKQETTDPPLFRLLAFDAEWIRPLLTNMPRDTIHSGIRPSAPQSQLDITLAVEAAQWVRLGQAAVYFPDPAPERIERSLAQLDNVGDHLDVSAWFVDSWAGVLDPQNFARSLANSREALTGERRTFLRLLFFTSEDDYSKRVAEVDEIADALNHRPWLILPPETVDRIAWSLEHPGPTSAEHNASPAWWRMTYQATSWETSSLDAVVRGRRTAADRWKELERIRNPLLTSSQWKLEFEATPTEIRSSAAASQPRGDLPADWPPGWAGLSDQS